MISPVVARSHYVVPALNKLNKYSKEAEYLLMGTAAVESNFTNFVQFGLGPARGMFQMEEGTFDWILDDFLSSSKLKQLRDAVFSTAKYSPPVFEELTANHLLAAALARVKYASIPDAIPMSLEKQADYWWVHYNGRSANGLKPKDYLDRWSKYCASIYPGFK